jgi:hypothetical protein
MLPLKQHNKKLTMGQIVLFLTIFVVLQCSATLPSDTILENVQDAIRPKGHLLFFFPVIPKSAMITFMPVAEELAKRGHQVIIYA